MVVVVLLMVVVVVMIAMMVTGLLHCATDYEVDVADDDGDAAGEFGRYFLCRRLNFILHNHIDGWKSTYAKPMRNYSNENNGLLRACNLNPTP